MGLIRTPHKTAEQTGWLQLVFGPFGGGIFGNGPILPPVKLVNAKPFCCYSVLRLPGCSALECLIEFKHRSVQ